MKLKVFITALLLGLALPAAADMNVVQEAYEVALDNMRLPRAESGTIAFKECDKCEYVRLRVGDNTQYMIDDKAVSLRAFREALSLVEDRDTQPVTVLHHLERNQVTAVSVYL